MKRIFMSIVHLVAVAVAGVSCLQLEQPALNENLSGDEIVFGADAYIEAETKASSGTSETTSLSSFYVSAVSGSAGSEASAFNSTQFTQVTGSSPAVYTGGKMWAATDQGWKFYASNTPLTFHADGTTVAASNTTDVVCAYLTNGTYKTKNTLSFEHIFARFGRVDVVAEDGYTISNISIRITPKTGGTYNLRTGAGQTDGTGWSSTTNGSVTTVANQIGANGNDIYLVPGTYSMTATWTATNSGVSVTYTDKVVNVPAVAGKTNIYSVVLGGEITFGVDLAEYCNYDYRDNLDYLTFYCDEAGTIGWSYFGAGSTTTIQYSKDFGTTWTNLTSTSEGATFSVSAGDIVWFKGNGSSYKMNHFTATNKFHVYGNINSLLNWNNTFSTTNVFQGLFYNCSTLYTYKDKKVVLPTLNMTYSCYNNLFYGCSSMEYAPDFPATTLAQQCYSGMFRDCTSLKEAPELPATTMADNCYSSMFRGCTSLVKVSDLPATVAAPQCYYYMFEGCTSLKVAPVISATVLAQQCCTCMFKDCTSLTEPPVLPATTLAEECYGGMFQSCTSLVKAPDLPATVMAPKCYYYMFSRCSSLKVAPVISATVLAQECCYGMFNKCSALIVAPDLPATTLAEECYTGMFQYCSSLVKAPDLPATTLVSKCYSWMFFSCSSLNYIKAMFTTTPSDSYTEGWVEGVAATGTFVKNIHATWDVTGTNGVPTGWTTDFGTSFGTFGGVMIAPAPLYYDGTIFKIKDNDWNHDSYNLAFGRVAGSYYFDYVELGQFFDSRGSVFDEWSGDIDNMGGKVTYAGYNDWRLPTLAELHTIFEGDSPGFLREGATVNGSSGVRFAVVQLTGVVFTNNDAPLGILVFPDGRSINGKLLTGYNSDTITVGMSNEELQNYLTQGCAFLPAGGGPAHSTFYRGGKELTLFSNDTWSVNPSKVHYFVYSQGNTPKLSYLQTLKSNIVEGWPYWQCYLVRSVKPNDEPSTMVKTPKPIGKFTINSSGDQVGFAPGNLQCTIASGPDATGYNYTGKNWCFADHQWDYLGNSDSANSFTVGKKMDLFGWVGDSASYDSYGLCSYDDTNNAYYGIDDDDALKTDWGDIPGVVSNYGAGWFTPSNDDWGYVFNTRTTGNTVNGTPDARYTEATIRTDISGVNGIILFPDDYSAGTPSGVTWGTINAASAWGTQCTAAGWASLEAAGCVFIPAAGYREGGGVDNVGGYAYYWSSSPGGVDGARDVRFGSGRVNLQYEGHRLYGFSVRLAKRVN